MIFVMVPVMVNVMRRIFESTSSRMGAMSVPMMVAVGATQAMSQLKVMPVFSTLDSPFRMRMPR